MMYRHLSGLQRRKGAVVPLTALLIIFLLGMVAFTVDMGYIVLVRQELQNAADSAALAGVAKLLDPSLLQGAPNPSQAMANARAEALRFARQNTGGGVALDLVPNPSNDPNGDIVCGYLANGQSRGSAIDFTRFPNSVQVTVRRDAVKNGSLSLFFARALGQSTINLEATATATAQGNITGFRFQSPASTECKLLPFALDINAWYQVVFGLGPDQFTRDPVTGAVAAGSDGIHECTLYPQSNGNVGGLPAGNFGTLVLGASDRTTDDLARQVLYGPSADDLAYFPNSTIQLDPNTGTLTLPGDTGVSVGLKDQLTSIIGQSRIIALYSSVSGNGTNANYTVVGFAGVTVTEVVLTGSLADMHLTIQPCFAIDGTAIAGTGAGTTSWFVSRPFALTR
jgi:Flp pilus assembly protein TadG